MMSSSSISIALLLLPHLILMGDTAIHALQLPTDATIQTNRRRDFIIRGSIDATLCRYFLCYPYYPAFAADDATTLPPPSSSLLMSKRFLSYVFRTSHGLFPYIARQPLWTHSGHVPHP